MLLFLIVILSIKFHLLHWTWWLNILWKSIQLELSFWRKNMKSSKVFNNCQSAQLAEIIKMLCEITFRYWFLAVFNTSNLLMVKDGVFWGNQCKRHSKKRTIASVNSFTNLGVLSINCSPIVSGKFWTFNLASVVLAVCVPDICKNHLSPTN